MVGGGSGGWHWHRRGLRGVGARQPVIAAVLVTQTHSGVVIAHSVQAVLTHEAAILVSAVTNSKIRI